MKMEESNNHPAATGGKEMMMTIDIEIDLACNECNVQLKATFRRGVVYVTPCKDCMDAAVEESTNG